jgi:hypothetical protein
MLLVVAITIGALFATTQVSTAMPYNYQGTMYIIGYGLVNVWTGPMVYNPPIIIFESVPVGSALYVISGGEYIPGIGGKFRISASDYASASSLVFDFIANENLQVKSNVDGVCSVYELTSGKQLSKIVVNSNTYQIIDIQFENRPYLIQFEVNGQIAYQQSFYFSNNNVIVRSSK